MTVYHLAAKPAVAQAMQMGLPVSNRLAEVATNAGYIIGPGGIQVYADGSVTIDLDRDPSADWATFDPTILTQAETEAVELRTEVIAYLEALQDADELLTSGIATLKGASPPSTVAALRPYVTTLAEMTLSHNRGIKRMILLLIERGILEGA